MKISILTLFPNLYDQFLKTSLVARAQEKNIVQFNVSSFFSYTEPKKRIDAPTFGPGAGMLLKPEIVEKAIDDNDSKSGVSYKIFFSPHGKKLDQKLALDLSKRISKEKHVMLVCPRYEGMDARVEEYYADEIISIGDYVLMGGDLPCMVLLEALLRLIPGVVSKEESVEQESFSSAFVDYPEYTEPVEWKGMKVPDIVRSGNHAEIKKWRSEQAVQRTVIDHFDWLSSHVTSSLDKKLSIATIPSHYVALMHSDVILRDGIPGTTSVTSLDLHDIARSACTYAIEHYFIVTPLVDQQKIVQKMLDFWMSDWAISYNPHRHEAVSKIMVIDTLDAMINQIEQWHGKKPVLIATSAHDTELSQKITYNDQGLVWKLGHPVLFLLGTGGGLSIDLLHRCDFVLTPIEGFSDFNHLSVRSAAAIILDRWLGISLKK